MARPQPARKTPVPLGKPGSQIHKNLSYMLQGPVKVTMRHAATPWPQQSETQKQTLICLCLFLLSSAARNSCRVEWAPPTVAAYGTHAGGPMERAPHNEKTMGGTPGWKRTLLSAQSAAIFFATHKFTNSANCWNDSSERTTD